MKKQERGRSRLKNLISKRFLFFLLRTPPISAGLLTLLLFTAPVWWSCAKDDFSAKVKTITIAVPPLEQNALLYVADFKKFFSDHGLRVVIKEYNSGVTAINGLLKGEAELAEAAEFPFVRAVFQKEKIRIIACNDKFENDYLVGRKDRGIKNISDLKGKRIGLTFKTINEFYLGRLLALKGMSLREVKLVDLAPAHYVKAIAAGEVDALIAWQPYIHQIEHEVNGVVIWSAQSSQAVFGILVCGSGWLTSNTDTVKLFLESLKEAEDYLVRHPNEAKTIVQKRLNYDDSYMKRFWPQHRFALSLDQALIIAMKDEAQWMINNNLTGEKRIPDFTKYIYLNGLLTVKPEAVNIIH